MGFSEWKYCQDHIITIASEVSDYQVKFIIYYLNGTSSGEVVYCNYHCKSDFSDVRFSVDGSTSLPYYIENYQEGVSATIWVKLPTIATTQTISVIYGNPDAESESDGDTTFVFFDNFDGTSIDTSKWSVTGAVTVSGGRCTIPYGMGALGITGKTIYGPGLAMHYTVRAHGHYNYKCFGITNTGSTASAGVYFTTEDTGVRARSETSGSSQQSALVAPLDREVDHTFISYWTTTTVKLYIDGVQVFTTTWTSVIPTISLYPRFTTLNEKTSMEVASIFIRSLVASEPVHSTWSAEGEISAPTFKAEYMLGCIQEFDSQYSLGQPLIYFSCIYDTVLTFEFESIYKTHLTANFEDIYGTVLAAQFRTILRSAVPFCMFRTRIKTQKNTLACKFEEY